MEILWWNFKVFWVLVFSENIAYAPLAYVTKWLPLEVLHQMSVSFSQSQSQQSDMPPSKLSEACYDSCIFLVRLNYYRRAYKI